MDIDKPTWKAQDGIVDVDLWKQQKIKILWVLREPNGDNFDFMEYLQNVTVYPRWKCSYGLVVKLSRVILDNRDGLVSEYNECNPQVMKRIALVNIKSTGGQSSINRNEYSLYAKGRDNVKEFLDKVHSINPDLILCGGTYGDIPEEVKSKYKCVNLYHPNQKTIPHAKYIDDALKIIRTHT